MSDAPKQAESTSTAAEREGRPAQIRPVEVEVLQPFVTRPPEEIDRGAFGNRLGRSVVQPPRATPSEASHRIDKPDEFGGILPAQLHRERPGARVRTLLAAVLEATAADLGRGGDCRAEALRWISYRRRPGDRSLGFTLGEICERLELNVHWTRERLAAIEVEAGGASRRDTGETGQTGQ